VVVAAAVAAGAWAWRERGLPTLSSKITRETVAHASSGPTAAARNASKHSKRSDRSARRNQRAAGPINPKFPGLRTFRGNASRAYYGEGPLPTHPVVRWRYPPSGGLCAVSSDGTATTTWCGTGWTGQPNVIPRPGGGVEVREGAFDDNYHFLDGHTGKPLRPDLHTGDLAKGSATSDSDGYPLYYAGSRDNYLRIVALDRPSPTVLWSFNADTQPGGIWNNDWDGAPLQIGDYVLEGGENSWFYVIRLNRGYDSTGKVEVHPRIVMRVPGWDQALHSVVYDDDLSIENSVAFRDGVVYFSNSGGLVQGWDIRDVLNGGTHYKRVFRFWSGDDNDASIVISPHGDLIVGRKMEENVSRPESFPRDHEIGDLMKLDPHKPSDPLVWSVQLGGFDPDDGVLGTPAYYKGVVYASYTDGGVAAVDAATGKVLWNKRLTPPTWSSPVPIDDELLMADGAGNVNCFDISNPRRPPRLRWRVHLSDSVIESTPAVWHRWIYVGSRDGGIYAISDPRGG
jgi:outer membrane protein assembly factor BamB